VPKSRVRKKKVYSAPTEVRRTESTRRRRPSPRWVPIAAIVLIVAGIGWLVTYYLVGGSPDWAFGPFRAAGGPEGGLGAWNLAIGFSMLVASLAVLTQWR